MAIPPNQQSTARHQVHQPLERGLNFVEVLVNIGMVELDGCQNHGVRKVVHEFWTFVAERRVVFVAFHNELSPRTQHERAAGVFWDSADKETGAAPGMMEQPCQ